MNLQIEVKSNVVIFHDESVKWITSQEFQKLFSIWSNPDIDNVVFSGNGYRKSAIAKILTADEFYQEYPQEKPKPESQKFESPPDPRPFDPLKAAGKRIKAVESLIRGYTDERINILGLDKWEATKANDTLYQRMIKRLRDIKPNKDKQDFTEAFGSTPEVIDQAEEIFDGDK